MVLPLLLLLVALPSQLWVLILPLLLAAIIEMVATLQLCRLLLLLLVLLPLLPPVMTAAVVGTTQLCVLVPPSSLLLPAAAAMAIPQLCSAGPAAEGQAAV